MRRARIVRPLVRSRAIPSTLRRDDKVLRVRRQRFRDQFFADIRTIGVSRVDEIDSQLNGSSKYSNCGGGILRWSPDSVARNAHRPESKAVDDKFTTQRNCS